MNRPGCQRRSAEVIRRKQAGGVLWIRARNVDANALQDDEDAGAVDDDPGDGYDPVDVGTCRPAKEEEPDGWEDGGRNGREEPVFLRRRRALIAEGRVYVEVKVAAVDACAEEAGDDNANEERTELWKGEMVEWRIDQSEDFEKHIIDRISEAYVCVCEAHGRVLERYFQRFYQSIGHDGTSA